MTKGSVQKPGWFQVRRINKIVCTFWMLSDPLTICRLREKTKTIIELETKPGGGGIIAVQQYSGILVILLITLAVRFYCKAQEIQYSKLIGIILVCRFHVQKYAWFITLAYRLQSFSGTPPRNDKWQKNNTTYKYWILKVQCVNRSPFRKIVKTYLIFY